MLCFQSVFNNTYIMLPKKSLCFLFDYKLNISVCPSQSLTLPRVLYNLSERKKKGISVVQANFKSKLHFTLSRAYESCLAC